MTAPAHPLVVICGSVTRHLGLIEHVRAELENAGAIVVAPAPVPGADRAVLASAWRSAIDRADRVVAVCGVNDGLGPFVNAEIEYARSVGVPAEVRRLPRIPTGDDDTDNDLSAVRIGYYHDLLTAAYHRLGERDSWLRERIVQVLEDAATDQPFRIGELARRLARRASRLRRNLRDVGRQLSAIEDAAGELPEPDGEHDGVLWWVTALDVKYDNTAPGSPWPKFGVGGKEMHRDAVVELRDALNAVLARDDGSAAGVWSVGDRCEVCDDDTWWAGTVIAASTRGGHHTVEVAVLSPGSVRHVVLDLPQQQHRIRVPDGDGVR